MARLDATVVRHKPDSARTTLRCPQGGLPLAGAARYQRRAAIKNWAAEGEERPAGDRFGGDDTGRDRRPPRVGQHRRARLVGCRLPGAHSVVAVLWLTA